MTRLNSTAIAALLTAAIGLTAAAPAMAQDSTTAPAVSAPATDLQVAKNGWGPGKHHQGGPRQGEGGPMKQGGPRGPGGPGGLMGIFGFERGAEALEIAFVRLSHVITLTDAQKPLFDDLKTTALTAQTEFSDAVEAARPAADVATPPDIAAVLKSRIALETAHAKALSTVLPKLEAFTASLTDEQKTALTPQRPNQAAFGQRNGNWRHPGNGPVNPAPQGDIAPPAPPAAPAPDAAGAPTTNG